MPSVLFVCTGNICRSPMAAALFRSKIGSDPAALGWDIESTGTWAVKGAPASHNAQLVMQEWGLDISAHRSKPVDGPLLSRYNLILTMESGHKEALQAEFPEIAGRVHLLSEMVGKNHDIVDPIGSSLEDYEDTAREIDQILNKGFQKILKLSQDK